MARLLENANDFLELAMDSDLDIGISAETAVVPVVLGSSIMSIVVAHKLFERGIFVHPLFYPIVPERSARLRFFFTAIHTWDEIRETVQAVADATREAGDLFKSLPPKVAEQLLQFATADQSGIDNMGVSGWVLHAVEL